MRPPTSGSGTWTAITGARSFRGNDARDLTSGRSSAAPTHTTTPSTMGTKTSSSGGTAMTQLRRPARPSSTFAVTQAGRLSCSCCPGVPPTIRMRPPRRDIGTCSNLRRSLCDPMCLSRIRRRPGGQSPATMPMSPRSTIASAACLTQVARRESNGIRSSFSPRTMGTCSTLTAVRTSSSRTTSRSECRFCSATLPCLGRRVQPSTRPSTRRTSCRRCSA